MNGGTLTKNLPDKPKRKKYGSLSNKIWQARYEIEFRETHNNLYTLKVDGNILRRFFALFPEKRYLDQFDSLDMQMYKDTHPKYKWRVVSMFFGRVPIRNPWKKWFINGGRVVTKEEYSKLQYASIYENEPFNKLRTRAGLPHVTPKMVSRYEDRLMKFRAALEIMAPRTNELAPLRDHLLPADETN